MVWALVAVALALTPQQADDRIRSMNDLEAVPELARPIVEPVRIRQGVVDVVLRDGAMVPVFSGRFAGAWEHEGRAMLRRLREGDPDATLPGPEDRGDRELVGFVWLRGEGAMGVRFPLPADAHEWANREVLHMGADPETVADVAHGIEPLRLGADEGLVLSVDPALDALFLGPEGGDPYDIVVWEAAGDLSRAQGLLERRLAVWEALGVDLGDRIAEARVASDLGIRRDPLWLVDLATDRRFARISEQPSADDRWVAWLDRGGLTQSWTGEVVVAGVTPQGTARWSHLSGVAAPTVDPQDRRSAPVPRGRAFIAHAEARILAAHERNGMVLPVELTTRLTLEAREDLAFLELVVPRVEEEVGGFEWVGASLPDGTPLARPEQVARKGSEVTAAPPPKPDPPRPRDRPKVVDRDDDPRAQRAVAHRVRLAFPEPLQAGEQVTVDLQWRDVWPLAHLTEWANVGLVNDGVTSGLQRFLPTLADAEDLPHAYVATVGLPSTSRLSVAISGPQEEPHDGGDGWRWVRVEGPPEARNPNVVIGRYTTHEERARKGMPEVRLALFGGDRKKLQTLSAQVRAVMAYYESYLPPYGLPSYQLVQAPAGTLHATWIAPHAMQVSQTMNVMGSVQAKAFGAPGGTSTGMTQEHTGWRLFGHEIAHQWFGQQLQPASLEDRWMVESLAEVYACMFVAKVTDDVETCVDRHEATRKDVEGAVPDLADRRVSASLTEAYLGGPRGLVVYRYGPYVMQQMLRPRIGNAAFFGALDQLLREHPREAVTNERLQHAFERASGQDLSDFFDFWVRQGLVPGVEVEVQVHSDVVEVEVHADVPFGVFDVPVVLTDPTTGRRHVEVIEVAHGKGYAEVERIHLRGGVQAQVDPGHRTLLTRRALRVREVD